MTAVARWPGWQPAPRAAVIKGTGVRCQEPVIGCHNDLRVIQGMLPGCSAVVT